MWFRCSYLTFVYYKFHNLRSLSKFLVNILGFFPVKCGFCHPPTLIIFQAFRWIHPCRFHRLQPYRKPGDQ